MTANGLFALGRPGTHLHDILWAVHDGKIVVEARARQISGTSRLRWVVGVEQCTEVCVFLSYMYTCVCEALVSN